MSAAGGAKSEMGGATRVYAVCSADDVNSNNGRLWCVTPQDRA